MSYKDLKECRCLDWNALARGPLAVLEAIGNDITVMFAPEIKETPVKTTTEVTKEEAPKAEIVEFKPTIDQAKSIINADFIKNIDTSSEIITDDELLNIVDDAVEKVIEKSKLNLDEEQFHIVNITLVFLISTGKITSKQLIDCISYKTGKSIKIDDIIEVNTIHKFFNGTKLFTSQGAIQLNEIITSQLLFETVTTVFEQQELENNDTAVHIVEKCRKRLEQEIASNGIITGDEVDPVTPIYFNPGILSKINLDGKSNIDLPKLGKLTQEYITNHLYSLLPEDWVKENMITLKLTKAVDEYDYTSFRDTGLALLEVLSGEIVVNKFYIDLDNITGNGYCIMPRALYTDKGISYIYVNIEKFPEIVKSLIMNQPYMLNDPNIPESVLQFNQVMEDIYIPEIYMYYDFSGMSKHFSFMTNEEKQKLGMNLAWISQVDWINSEVGEPYRMRFRDYKNPNKFTLVSDKNTRQQIAGMLPVIGNNYKKYINSIENFKDESILVVKFDNGKIEVTLNGENKDIKLPKEYRKN